MCTLCGKPFATTLCQFFDQSFISLTLSCPPQMARFILALVALLAVASSAEAAMSAQQVVNNIKNITTQSQALQVPAQTISIINGPLIVVGQGPFTVLLVGFTNIVSTATSAMVRHLSDMSVLLIARGD